MKVIDGFSNSGPVLEKERPAGADLLFAESRAELPGVLCDGVQYLDLRDITYISNNGIAQLIGVLKSLLSDGKKLRLVNVDKKVREKIRAMGLEEVLICL